MIEVGDRVTYKNLEGNIVTTLVHNNVDKIATKEILKTRELIKIERPEWRVIEEKKEILTGEEKEFLKSYLKFMRLEGEDMRFTKKLNILYCLFDDDSGYKIQVDYSNFREIKSNRLYTLEELRIGGINGRRYKKNRRNTKV